MYYIVYATRPAEFYVILVDNSINYTNDTSLVYYYMYMEVSSKQ
jgi:hypothetical protein